MKNYFYKKLFDHNNFLPSIIIHIDMTDNSTKTKYLKKHCLIKKVSQFIQIEEDCLAI
jgi:hypothetical protein